jgi:hypothetical protein
MTPYDIRRIYKDNLKSICILFPDCVEVYKETIEQLKLEYYLSKYASRHWDVFMLVQGKTRYRSEVPSKYIEYSVVNLNDPRYHGRDHGEMTYIGHTHNVVQQFTFVDKEKEKLYMRRNDFDKLLGVGPCFKHRFTKIGEWDRVLICRNSFPFLYEENISLKIIGDYLNIKPGLSVEKFKELVNLKEKHVMFILEPAKK